jgi:hypothetical protein
LHGARLPHDAAGDFLGLERLGERLVARIDARLQLLQIDRRESEDVVGRDAVDAGGLPVRLTLPRRFVKEKGKRRNRSSCNLKRRRVWKGDDQGEC